MCPLPPPLSFSCGCGGGGEVPPLTEGGGRGGRRSELRSLLLVLGEGRGRENKRQLGRREVRGREKGGEAFG